MPDRSSAVTPHAGARTDGVPLSARHLPIAAEAVLFARDGRHRVSYRLPIPYFGFLWAPWVARRARRIERAADAGEPLPSDTPWWAPPETFSARPSEALAALCLITMLWSYGGGTLSLLSLTLPYAADTYSVDNTGLATGLAIVRVGVLLALILGPLADRFGRRRLVIAAACVHCVVAAVIGLAPSFQLYIAGHVVLRCVDTALGIAIAVLVAEIVPAGARAVALSLVGLAAGGGIVLAVSSLPLAAAGRAGFAAVYMLQLLAIPLILHAARYVSESPRFLRHAGEPHRYREVLRGIYRRRLLLIGTTTFLAAAFVAPTLEFTTRYLDDTHGFSSFEIVLFLALTGLPSFPMLTLGGRLSDTVSRKAVGVPLVGASTVAYAGFYLASGWLIWPLALAGAMCGSAGGAALAPYASELFATRMRSEAQTLHLVMGVTGSAMGLGIVSLLSGSLGLGPSISALALLPLVGLAIVAAAFPETTRRELEDTSGERVSALRAREASGNIAPANSGKLR
jgi:predicted MFS family arabinose efflux permease